MKKWLLGFSALLGLFLIWQGCCYYHSTLFFILPTPINVAKKIYSSHQLMLMHTIATLKEMSAGMGLAAVVAFPLAALMARFAAVRSLLQPLFILLQCLPMFTLAPLMVIWCGWSFSAIVIPTALMVLFPMTINLCRGLMATPVEYLEFFRVHRASPAKIFFKLQLPYALPQLFAGLRISAAVAGVGAIAGEWAGAQKGLGVYIQECRHDFNLEGVFGGLICLLFLTLCFYGMVALLEKLFTRGRQLEKMV